jgi:hypothetical protein
MTEKSMIKARNLQEGLTFLSLLVVLTLIILALLVGVKVAPSVIENHGINSALQHSLNEGKSVVQIRDIFDRTAETGYIESINGKDLVIDKGTDGRFSANYAYTKKIPLFGPVFLVIEYAGSAEGP